MPAMLLHPSALHPRKSYLPQRPTPTFTLEQLLADALNLLNGGSYEEAILAYNHIIEIEPKRLRSAVRIGQGVPRRKAGR